MSEIAEIKEEYARLRLDVAKNRLLIIELTKELNKGKDAIRTLNDQLLDVGLRQKGMSLQEVL